MKLYFKKPITDSAKLKFLEWYLTDNACSAETALKSANKIIEGGFYVTYTSNDKTINKLKALNIWEEKKVIGKFWDDDENEYVIGMYEGKEDDEYRFPLVDSVGYVLGYYKNFKQITSLEEIN